MEGYLSRSGVVEATFLAGRTIPAGWLLVMPAVQTVRGEHTWYVKFVADSISNDMEVLARTSFVWW